MFKLGKYNKLQVLKAVDFGVYLDGGEGTEILLPSRYIGTPLQPGDTIEVFVYRDNEERLIATTEHPYAQVDEFAFLQVSDVNRTGAFLDWGLMKQLLVPFSEQTFRLERGMIVPVYVYIDHASGRIVASAKIERFIGNVVPRYKLGARVKALVYKRTDLGYKAIVDNLHSGFFYESGLYGEALEIGQEIPAYVNRLRPDGKIDLLLHGAGDGRIDDLAAAIRQRLENEAGHFIALDDSSSPEVIREAFGCSKKDFKKAIGALYKQRVIGIEPGGIRLV